MLLREVKAIYFQIHEENITEVRWEGADLIQLAQDGEYRRALLNTAMEFRVP